MSQTEETSTPAWILMRDRRPTVEDQYTRHYLNDGVLRGIHRKEAAMDGSVLILKDCGHMEVCHLRDLPSWAVAWAPLPMRFETPAPPKEVQAKSAAVPAAWAHRKEVMPDGRDDDRVIGLNASGAVLEVTVGEFRIDQNFRQWMPLPDPAEWTEDWDIDASRSLLQQSHSGKPVFQFLRDGAWSDVEVPDVPEGFPWPFDCIKKVITPELCGRVGARRFRLVFRHEVNSPKVTFTMKFTDAELEAAKTP